MLIRRHQLYDLVHGWISMQMVDSYQPIKCRMKILNGILSSIKVMPNCLNPGKQEEIVSSKSLVNPASAARPTQFGAVVTVTTKLSS